MGIDLGVVVAILWGSGDILATLAARQISSFRTAFLSQLAGLIGLLVLGAGALWFGYFFFPSETILLGGLFGLFTGLCAALGYMALYRSLELGPVAIVGPLTATSPIFTLILAALILRENLTLESKGLVVAGILGVILASLNLSELGKFFRKSGSPLRGSGVRWAIVATFAFGAVDFGIGASASLSHWFLAALWTRFFTLVFLVLFSSGRLFQRWFRRQAGMTSQITQSLPIPVLKNSVTLKPPSPDISLGVLLALLVGVIEDAAILTFSFATRIATTGVTSAIASSYGLFVMLFGLLVYREKPGWLQLLGVAIFMISLFLLAM
ncbi:MAG TPA: DMT family transporter [Ktedonobacteraceae bacterium]|nr:DMT family transporter [Ktedonobacteraceae bacterium]